MGLAQRRKAQQYQDTQTLARYTIQGRGELVAEKLKIWPELYHLTPEQMWADALAILSRWLPYFEDSLEWMQAQKERGVETYYSFATGRMTMDEAIEWQESRIRYAVEALSAGMPE